MAAFDPIAKAMGKAGASRDLVSALMGGSGGGGGSGTLEQSGWVKSLSGGATVSGNRVTLPSGSDTHNIQISPPGAKFAIGDEVTIAFTVVENWQRVTISWGGQTTASMTSKTGFVQRRQYNDYCDGTGSDVVTYSYLKAYNNGSFSPSTSTGSGSADAYATIDITGIKYNGTLIFGKV